MKIIEKWILTKDLSQVMLVSPKFIYLEGARDMNNPF